MTRGCNSANAAVENRNRQGAKNAKDYRTIRRLRRLGVKAAKLSDFVLHKPRSPSKDCEVDKHWPLSNSNENARRSPRLPLLRVGRCGWGWGWSSMFGMAPAAVVFVAD